MTITLKTLPDATAQEVFDQVVTHLLTQGRPSAQGGHCLYRSENGLKCAAGCLIGDGEYDEEMEESSWMQLAGDGLVPLAHDGLIQALQEVHDSLCVDDWPELCRRVARSRDLSTAVIDRWEANQ